MNSSVLKMAPRAMAVMCSDDELRVSLITVDKGTSLKRSSARAKGRGNQIEKQTCHIAITVADQESARPAARKGH